MPACPGVSSAEAGQRAPVTPGERWTVALLCCLLVVASVCIRGYRYPFVNQAVQLPLVQALRDPSLYPHDAFVATLHDYCAWYWVLVARLGGPNPAGLLFALYLLTNIGRLLAAAATARALFPASRLAPWVAAALWAAGPRAILGGGNLFAPCANHTATSIVLLLLAFVALLKDRPWWWALCFAAGVLANPMYGVHALVYFGLAAALLLAQRALSVRWAWAAVASAALIAPGLVWSWSTADGLSGMTAAQRDLWYVLAEARVAHHLFPLTWGWSAFALHGLVLAGVVLGLRLGARLGARAAAVMLSAVVASVVWLGTAFVAAYAVRVPVLLALHPARGLDLFYALAGLYLTGLMVQRLEVQHQAGRGLLWPVLGLLGAFGVWFILKPEEAGLLLLPLVGGIVLTSPLWSRALQRLSFTQMRTGLCLLAGALALAVALARHVQGDPMVFSLYRPRPLADAARWAAAATPRDATFLVNPATDEYFRPLSQRSVFITWKDGGALPWSASFGEEWARRMAALGYDPRQPDRALDRHLLRRQTDASLQRLAARYRLDYALLEATHPTRLPVVYRNSALKIVALRPPPGVTSPAAAAPRGP